MKPAIRVEQLSKHYRIGARHGNGYRTLRESIMQVAMAPYRCTRDLISRPSSNHSSIDSHLALEDVSFEVQPGEVIGIIGRNGAGKSTLLKVLSRITEPTSGRIELRGRVGSLLEVGTGFHPELTGRENIYLNGAILGMTRREIARKFNEIVAFAEIDRFLDTPVKRYSSGMYVRLAFAVASHMETEILLVDEILAVGDHAFQKKCLGKMGQLGRTGRTVLFVSHNMATILNLCERVAILERGKLVYLGGCQEGVKHYVNSQTTLGEGEADLSSHRGRHPGCTPIFRKLRLLCGNGNVTNQFVCGEAMSVALEVDAPESTHELNFGIWVEDAMGCRLFAVGTHLSNSRPMQVIGRQQVRCDLDQLPLAPGRYYLSLVAGPMLQMSSDMIDQAAWFEVTASDYYGNGRLPKSSNGPFLVRSRWKTAEL